MSGDQYNEAYKAVMREYTPERHANIMIQIANIALSMIHSRITETGLDSKNQRFREYSEWYKKYKQEKGKYHGFTDFSFTTRMWTNIQVITEKCTENKAIISAKDKGTSGSRKQITVNTKAGKTYNRSIYEPSNYEKLEKNSESFGMILELTKEEIEILRKQYDQLLLEPWTKHGLRA